MCCWHELGALGGSFVPSLRSIHVYKCVTCLVCPASQAPSILLDCAVLVTSGSCVHDSLNGVNCPAPVRSELKDGPVA